MGLADEGDEIRSSRVDLNLNPASRNLQSSGFESNIALSSPTTEENCASNDLEPTNLPLDHNVSIDGDSNQGRSPPSIEHPSPPIREDPPSYDTQSHSDDSLDLQEMDDETLHPLPLRTLSPLFTLDVSSSPPDVSILSPPEIVHHLFAPTRAAWSARDESPTYHFDRFTELSYRFRGVRSSISYHDAERSSFVGSNSPDIRSSQRTLECNGEKRKVQAEGIEMESVEEKSTRATNFECNICFDMAQEPVVTSCGHLFCWSCLYQWLHVHSEYKTCPVCKGEVIESSITPIYGRGSPIPSGAENLVEGGDSDVKIPPRPRGNRFENPRQHSRPTSRRLRTNRNRFEGYQMYHPVFARLRERILLREESNTESGNANSLFNYGIGIWDRLGDSTILPSSGNTNTYSDYGHDDWHRFQAVRTERLQNSSWGLFQADRTEHRHQASIGDGCCDGSRYEASTSSVNPTNLEQLIRSANVAMDSTSDQVSVPSTRAMVRGDDGHPEGSAVPNSAISE